MSGVEAARAFVLEAHLALHDGTDPAAAGAAVTVELCGHWEHEGPCRWPHNSEIDAEQAPALFRTLWVCGEAEAEDVRDRIERALRGAHDWRVVDVRARAVEPAEQALAGRLLSCPRAPG